MSVLLQLDRVSVQRGAVRVLSDVSLGLHAGERLALVGSNGSGKSTLLRTMHGLLPVCSGQVQHAPALRQAMLFQRPHLWRLTVLNNVTLALWLDRAKGWSWPMARERAWAALLQMGLEAVAQQNGRQLSGGQLQRVALACALAREPDLLLLDEPTASLDPHAKREVEHRMQTFAQGRHGQALTLVWASHNLGQVKRLATRVMYLEGGRLLADLPVADFFNAAVLVQHSPAAHAFVQGEQ